MKTRSLPRLAVLFSLIALTAAALLLSRPRPALADSWKGTNDSEIMYNLDFVAPYYDVTLKNTYAGTISIGKIVVYYTDGTQETFGTHSIASGGTTIFAATESTNKNISTVAIYNVRTL